MKHPDEISDNYSYWRMIPHLLFNHFERNGNFKKGNIQVQDGAR